MGGDARGVELPSALHEVQVEGLSVHGTTPSGAGQGPGPAKSVEDRVRPRFERFTPFKDSDVWNYFARKATTNPDAKTPLGGSCGELDEETYKYSWTNDDGPTSWADGDQLEFGVM